MVLAWLGSGAVGPELLDDGLDVEPGTAYVLRLPWRPTPRADLPAPIPAAAAPGEDDNDGVTDMPRRAVTRTAKLASAAPGVRRPHRARRRQAGRRPARRPGDRRDPARHGRAGLQGARRAQGRRHEVRPGHERLRGGAARGDGRALPRDPHQAPGGRAPDGREDRPPGPGARPSAGSGGGGSSPSTTSQPRPRPSDRCTVRCGRTARDVAVKVQYPGAGEALKTDLAQVVADGPARSGSWCPGLDVRPLVEELRERMIEELDYPLERDAQHGLRRGLPWRPRHRRARRPRRGRARASCPSGWTASRSSRVIADGTQAERDHAGQRYVRFLFASPARAGHAARRPAPRELPDPPRRPARGPGLRRRRPPPGRSAAVDRAAALRGPGRRRDHRRARDCARKASSSPRCPSTPSRCWPTWRRSSSPRRTTRSASTGPGCRRSSSGSTTRAPRTGPTGLKLNLPPEYLLVHRVWLGGVGVLCQLQAEVSLRTELETWLPGFSRLTAGPGTSTRGRAWPRGSAGGRGCSGRSSARARPRSNDVDQVSGASSAVVPHHAHVTVVARSVRPRLLVALSHAPNLARRTPSPSHPSHIPPTCTDRRGRGSEPPRMGLAPARSRRRMASWPPTPGAAPNGARSAAPHETNPNPAATTERGRFPRDDARRPLPGRS